MEAMKLPVAGFDGRRVLLVGDAAPLALLSFGRTPHAELFFGCGFTPVGEPDGDGDECFAPTGVTRKWLAPSAVGVCRANGGER